MKLSVQLGSSTRTPSQGLCSAAPSPPCSLGAGGGCRRLRPLVPTTFWTRSAIGTRGQRRWCLFPGHSCLAGPSPKATAPTRQPSGAAPTLSPCPLALAPPPCQGPRASPPLSISPNLTPASEIALACPPKKVLRWIPNSSTSKCDRFGDRVFTEVSEVK